MRVLAILAALLGGVMLFPAFAQQVSPQPSRTDASFIPADCHTAAVIDFKELKRSPIFNQPGIFELLREFLKQEGLDSGPVDQLRGVTLVGWGDVYLYAGAEQVPPRLGAVLRRVDPTPLAAVRAEFEDLTGVTEQATASGKAYLRAVDSERPSIALTDERTIVIAREPELQRMLAAGGKPGLVASLISQYRGTAGAVAAADIEAMRDSLMTLATGLSESTIAADSPNEPPELTTTNEAMFEGAKAAARALRDLRALFVVYDSTGDEALQLACLANSDAAVTPLLQNVSYAKSVVDALIEIGFEQNLSEAELEAQLERLSPDERAKVQQGLKGVDVLLELFRAVRPFRQGNWIITRIKGRAVVAATVSLFLPAFQSARNAAKMQLEQNEELPPPPFD